jgi:GH15 family glucan-1,4-alpha-glucosidase
LTDDGLAKRSIEVITSLQEEDGGFLATAKDDAYPFVYPRDAAIMTMALNLHGQYENSKAFYDYIAKVQRENGEVFQRYNAGHPFVSQTGEADVTPIVIQGVYDTFLTSGDSAFLERMWNVTAEGVSFIGLITDPGTGLLHTTRSVHEYQGLEEGFEIWANSAAVKGLLDASKIALTLRRQDAADAWIFQAKSLWRAIMEKLYDPATGLFLKNLRKDGSRVTAPDVAQVAPFYFGLTNDRSSLERTLFHLRETLWNEGIGGFNRFRDFEVVADWHWYTGGTRASWPLFTLWMAKLYRRLGDADSAEQCMRFVRRASTTRLDIPEKVAPLEGYQEWKSNETQFNERVQRGAAKAEGSSVSIPGYVAWACPLGWSHAEYLLLERKGGPEDAMVLADGH